VDLPTYTNIWRIEKRLYKLYDLRLPMPLPLVQIGVFVGVFVPWILLLKFVGVPFRTPWHVLYIVPPGVLTWLATRPVIEGKRLTELLLSQTRYLTEPRTWCRLTPIREPREVVVVARVWRQSGDAASPVAAAERAAMRAGRKAGRNQAKGRGGHVAPQVPAPARAAAAQTTAAALASFAADRPTQAAAPQPLRQYAARSAPEGHDVRGHAGGPALHGTVAAREGSGADVPSRSRRSGDRRAASAWRPTTRRNISHEPEPAAEPTALPDAGSVEHAARLEPPPAMPRLEAPPVSRLPATARPQETPARQDTTVRPRAQQTGTREAGPQEAEAEDAAAERTVPERTGSDRKRPVETARQAEGEPAGPPTEGRAAASPTDAAPEADAPQGAGDEQASASPAGSGKRALASGVRRPGAAAEFWRAIAPPEQPESAHETSAPQDPGRREPAAKGLAAQGPARPEPGRDEAGRQETGRQDSDRQEAGRREPAEGTGGERERAGTDGEPTAPAERPAPPPAPTTRPDIPQVRPAITRPDIPAVPVAFGADNPAIVDPVADEDEPDGEARLARPPAEQAAAETQVPSEEPPGQSPEPPGRRPAAAEPAGEKAEGEKAEGEIAEGHKAEGSAAGAPKPPPKPWSEGLSRPLRKTSADALVWPPPQLKSAEARSQERRSTAPRRAGEHGAGRGAPSRAPGVPPGRRPRQDPPPKVHGYAAASSDDPNAAPPPPPAPMAPEPPRPPAQPHEHRQSAGRGTPVGPRGASAPPPAVPPTPGGTYRRAGMSEVEPEVMPDAYAPPREVRSGPASPVRPRPLPPPPPPPAQPQAITPPDPDNESTAGGLRRLIHAVGGGHSQVDSEYEERLQRPFHGTRHIVVLGCTGGAGQTVTALMLGHTFAQYCGEPIVAIDVNPGPGALARRTRSETNETLTGLITRAGQVNTLTAMRRYTSQAKSGLDVITAGKNPLQALDDRDYALAIRTTDRFYSVTMLDAAAAVVARVLPYADQIVLVAPASADAPRAVAMTFEWLDGHGYDELRSHAVTVINGVSRRSMDDVEQAESVARGRCRALVRIPWDDHLSLDRSPRNELKSLRAPTRRAYLALAGVVAGGFAALPERYHQQEASR
jgi:MinD-like ATPase involved in chromosome partitioning or flagellar assembly